MTSTALKRWELDKTRGAFVNAPGVYFKIGKFDPAFNRGAAYNRKNTVMHKGKNGVCLLNCLHLTTDHEFGHKEFIVNETKLRCKN